jgi:hypothetical protein
MSRSKSKSNTKKTTPQPKKVVKADSGIVGLSKIVDSPSGKHSAFGVVLDATGAYKTYDSTDYVTKFKLIDASWNVDSKSDHQYKRFVHCFVYSESAAQAPRCMRVGDVVKMRNFEVIFKKIKTGQN